MKKLSLILIIITTLAIISCRKEESTYTLAYLTNKTTYKINVFFYNNGIIRDSIHLVKDMPFLYGRGNQRGLRRSPGFTGLYYIGLNDSVVIKFDSNYKVPHYLNSPINIRPKHYLFASIRNINNPLSYIFINKQNTKYSWVNEHFYEFTEADYIFASQ